MGLVRREEAEEEEEEATLLVMIFGGGGFGIIPEYSILVIATCFQGVLLARRLLFPH